MKRTPGLYKFVRTAGNADQYPDLEVKFIGGKAPTLIMLSESGEEERKMNLEKELGTMDLEDVHAYFQALGFVKKGDQVEPSTTPHGDEL